MSVGKIIENFLNGKLGKFEGVGSTLGTERKKMNSYCWISCRSSGKWTFGLVEDIRHLCAAQI